MIETNFCVYTCYQVDENNNLYPEPMGRIHARDESEAWEAWENYRKAEGLYHMTVTIIHREEDQVPAYIPV